MSSLIDSALIGCQCKVPLLSQYQSMASPQNIYRVKLTLLSETTDSICFHVRMVSIRRLRWILQDLEPVNRPKPSFIKITKRFATDFWKEVHSRLNGFQIQFIETYVIEFHLVVRSRFNENYIDGLLKQIQDGFTLFVQDIIGRNLTLFLLSFV